MNYYRFYPDSDTYDSVDMALEHDPSLAFDGRLLADSYQPIEVEVDPLGKRGDFPHMALHVPVCTDRALAVIRPLLPPGSEILPLVVRPPEYGPLHALNIPVFDALDREKAEFEDDGYDMISVDTFAFREDVLGGAAIFRIKGLHLSYCYMNDAFREAVERSGLEGLIFKPLPMV